MGNKKSPLFICFIGIDGSGKTTQAKQLVQTLEESGIKARYVWNRFEPYLIKPFIIGGKALFFRGKDASQNPAEYHYTTNRIFKNRLVSTIYQCLLLFDYLCQTQIKVRFPLLRGKSVVCDRFVHDTIVDLAVDFNYPMEKTKSWLKTLLYFLPKPDSLFLVDVPEEISLQRKKDTPPVILTRRRKVYLNIGKENKLAILDGDKSLVELKQMVWNRVAEEMK